MFQRIGKQSPHGVPFRTYSSSHTMFFRRQNLFFTITSPIPGTFVIAVLFKGREEPLLEMDLKIDDLLERVSLLGRKRQLKALTFWHTRSLRIQQQDGNTLLDLDYVQLHVNKTLALLNKVSSAIVRCRLFRV